MAIEVDVWKRVPVREQEPQVRAKNFEEVCYGYNEEEAMAEASRCIGCKNAPCMNGCPVSASHQHFLLYVDVYAHRRHSVSRSVSEESRARRYPSVSLRDLLLTGLVRTESSQSLQRR